MIKAVTIYNKVGRLRRAIEAEGTPAIKNAWAALEPCVTNSGSVSAVTAYNRIGRLRRAIRTEGTPAVQIAWDALEPYVSVFLNGGVQGGTGGEDAEDRSGSSDMGQS